MMMIPLLAFLMAVNLTQTKHFLVETENKEDADADGWEILLFWNTSIRIYGNVFFCFFSHLSFKTAIKKSFNKNHKTLSIRREGHKIPGFFLMVSLSFAFHPSINLVLIKWCRSGADYVSSDCPCGCNCNRACTYHQNCAPGANYVCANPMCPGPNAHRG